MLKVHPNGTPLTSIVESLENHEDKNLISVLSMNLLAPLYVRPIDKRTGQVQPFAAFEWVQDDAILEWDTRKLRLLDYMVTSQAEVICLQELQLERQQKQQQQQQGGNNDEYSTPLPLVLPEWIQPMVEKHGYIAILPPQVALDRIAARNLRVLGSDSAVSNAILVEKAKWKVLEDPAEEEDKEPIHKKPKGVQRIQNGKNSNTMVSVCLEPAASFKSQQATAADPVVISCVHLDATDERKRILQLTKCLERSRRLLDHQEGDATNTIRPLRAIIAGDMNAEFVPGSCMVATLKEYQQQKKKKLHEAVTASDEAIAEVAACTEALRLTCAEPPTKKQLEDWRQLRKEACDLVQNHCVFLDRVPTGPTRCAYEHTSMSNTEDTPRKMQSWKLDHLIYTCSDDDDDESDTSKDGSIGGVRPLAYWAALEADPTTCETGLPNATCPSDHLPIASVFEIPSGQNHKAKGNETSSAFLQMLQDFEKRHKEIVEQAKEEVKLKEQQLQQKELEKQKEEAVSKKDRDPADDDSKQHGKKKKKGSQKRSPPSSEMMELKREFRSRLKVFQKNQAQEREELVRDMGNREKLLLQAHYGIPWRQWLEQGPQ